MVLGLVGSVIAYVALLLLMHYFPLGVYLLSFALMIGILVRAVRLGRRERARLRPPASSPRRP